MNTEELLRPRYKVIATWPGMHAEPFHLGQVITLQPYEDEDYKGFIHIPIKHIPGSFMREGFFSGFPHLFKKLEWWEERMIEEMPAYIKSNDNRAFRPMSELTPTGVRILCRIEKWLPATLAEYEQYINQKEKQ